MRESKNGDREGNLMEAQTDSNNEFRQLLSGLLDGQLTPEQWRQLEQDIQNRPEAMRLYIETVTLTVGLRKYSQTQRGAMKEAILRQTPDESLLWQTLANEEKQAPAVIVEKRKQWLRWKPKPVIVRPREKNIHRVQRNISRIPVATLVVASAALVFLLLYVRLFPSMHMARLGDSMNAVWDNHDNRFREGRGLLAGSGVQTLKEGFAKIQFASGAQVLFEAPCQFELEREDQLFLRQGKVFVRVSKEAIGFVVRTPNCRIIDLGTEFGVKVDPDGTCQFQMFTGKASLIAGLAGQEKVSELLMAGQACSVEASAEKISVAPFQKEKFVQHIDSQSHSVWRGERYLALADFIAGGNGRGAEPQGCLNPVTGSIQKELKYLTQQQMQHPGTTYNAVPASPFMDGVFVPDGCKGPVVVSSLNHRFEFPKTSATIWYPVTALTYYVTEQNHGSQSPEPGAVPKPSFYIHANLGITFDLDAIRQAYPGLKITGFQTLYGIRWTGNPLSSKVDFWMLVDGEKKHQCRSKVTSPVMEKVYIPLSDTDRFLTLATTESNDGLWNDWGVFYNPVIELITAD